MGSEAMIKYQYNLIQGTEEWFSARCGLLTASEMKYIITPKKLEYAQNDKEKTHLYELAAQRISNYVEPSYVGDDMLRGLDDEVDAKVAYEKKYGRVKDCGFITNSKFGFTLGYSPDGLVGDDGAIECKGRRQKYQIETIAADKMPEDYIIQVQTGLLVSERKWMDFNSYCGGLPMYTKRIFPDQKIQDAILQAATIFHEKLDNLIKKYHETVLRDDIRLIATERRIEQEITL